MAQYSPSKWLIQACPPDLSESRVDPRWTYGVYEVLDERISPMQPRVLHTIYRGAVSLEAEELPNPADPLFAGRLEEAIVQKWKHLARGL
ncbi:MAG: hypothetical protein R3F62_09075 [Planctomycetota bacterium]